MASLASAAASPLAPLGGDYRPLVLFAPDENNRLLRNQLNIIENDKAGFAERDMAVIVVYPERAEVLMGPRIDASASAIRDHLDADNVEFRAVLIGKDRGVKARAETPYSASSLFGIIDAMPMRQSEMQWQGKDSSRP